MSCRRFGSQKESGGSVGLSVVGTIRSSCSPFLTPETFPLFLKGFHLQFFPPGSPGLPGSLCAILVVWDLLAKTPSYLHILQRGPTDTAVLRCSPALSGDYRAFPWRTSLGNPQNMHLSLLHPKIFTEPPFPFSLMLSRACCLRYRQSEQI